MGVAGLVLRGARRGPPEHDIGALSLCAAGVGLLAVRCLQVLPTALRLSPAQERGRQAVREEWRDKRLIGLFRGSPTPFSLFLFFSRLCLSLSLCRLLDL